MFDVIYDIVNYCFEYGKIGVYDKVVI